MRVAALLKGIKVMTICGKKVSDNDNDDKTEEDGTRDMKSTDDNCDASSES